jgi:hypothetical protein
MKHITNFKSIISLLIAFCLFTALLSYYGLPPQQVYTEANETAITGFNMQHLSITHFWN